MKGILEMKKYQQTKSLTALIAQESSTNLSYYQKETLAKLLIPVLLLDDCHKYSNRSYELPADFCNIYSAYLNLKEENDESYKTIHRFFLRCSKDNWDKISFFDIYDTLTILLYVAENKFSDSLRKHLMLICESAKNLDFLYDKYYLSTKTIFQNSDENTFKKNLLLSLCTSDRDEFLIKYKIKDQIDLIDSISKNPYK